MENWQLFIDESGELVHRRSVNVVTGLLIQEPSAKILDQRLRQSLGEVFPRIPYPPHASHLNIPASRIAGHALTPAAETPRDKELARRIHPAHQAVVNAEAPTLAEFKQALTEKRWPKYDAIQACNSWLADRERPLFLALRQLAEEQRLAMGALLQDMCDSYGPQRLFLVGAASVRKDGASENLQGQDLYMVLLQELFNRMVALLRSRDGKKRIVHVQVARRMVKGGRRPLRNLLAPDISAARAKALGFPHLAPDTPELSPPLRLITGAPVDLNHDSEAHPGLVLADHLSNRLFGALISCRSTGWENLTSAASSRFAIPLESIMRGGALQEALPGMATDGKPSLAVRGAFSGMESPDLAEVSPPWARDQAEAWIIAAQACRGASGRGGEA